MKTLGIDTNNSSLVYEGTSNWGYPVWPAPTLIAVTIVDESSSTLHPSGSQRDSSGMGYVLVDLGYDPTSRVRKGRLFKRFDGTQPSQWHVQPHPAILSERQMINTDGVLKKYLATYCDFGLTSDLNNQSISRPIYVLGNEHEFTIWSLVDVESTVSGEPLVYLKSRKVFGALPELSKDAVPT
ncbi:MAG: hypothetical protein KZQ86_00425, partial [Candidatus Thiodiazotropha sp. (ex Lucinoma kastoroae)]|nr:hypothetical protein [Candidatus Thiodiazotropha sp. (ex Lucinoma kastoroae)]